MVAAYGGRGVGPHIEVRPAETRDAHTLAQIERRCFDPSVYGHLLMSEAEFTRMVGRSRSSLIVAEIDGRLAGYAAVFFVRQKRLSWFYSHAVDEEFRGMGVGTRLFRCAEQQAVANDCPCMILEIRGKRELFQRYTRYGYSVIREIPGFYPDGSTAIRMGKLLTAEDAPANTRDPAPILAAI
ncbi:MAG: GNAT family N-acetyltransferase [Gammaproteobacteria bacterium]|nr:GNAT family N-acetyltransferase [Gammaproteobacteria bacterium]